MQHPSIPGGGLPATLKYLDGDYQIVGHGDFVVCAVTGKNIPLTDLRYWSVSRQEAYADAEAAHTAYARAQETGEAF